MVSTINKDILFKLYDDELFKDEVRELLDSLIVAELEKDEKDVNTALVDECVEIMAQLENEGAQYKGKNIIRFCKREARTSAVKYKYAAASVAFVLAAASVAAAANPVQARDVFNKIAQSLGIAADSTAKGDGEIVSLYGVYPSMNLSVKSETDIDLESIRVYAVYKDNSEKEIDIKDCEITYSTLENNKIMAIVSYGGSAFSIIFSREA
ncbi:MAG: hypothetical protein IJT65_00120 [Eubacterium sp.]|nr:hypothetical protein [Eubacterium sp.]